MFLPFVQRQRLGNNCHQHGSAGYTLRPNTHTHTETRVSMVTDTSNQQFLMKAFEIDPGYCSDIHKAELKRNFYSLILSLILSKSSTVVLVCFVPPLLSRESTSSEISMLIFIPHMVPSNKSKLYLHRGFSG